MRILISNWQDRLNPQSGGAEIHLHETFKRIAAKGHEVTLLVSGFDGAPQRAELDGMQVHRTGGRYTFNIAAPRYYRRHLANNNYDLFIEDLNKVPLFSPYFAKEKVALIVHHLFGRTAFDEATFPLAAATYLLEKPIPTVYRETPTVAVSNSTADDLRSRGFKGRIDVIPNGVDLEFFSPGTTPKSATPVVLYMGRLKRYKRVDLVVQAFARLIGHFPDARLIIGGRGDAQPELEALVAKLGVQASVDFVGFVTEEKKRELFRSAWIHVLTSSKEGWGITNIEAAACGTLTIASDAPGLRESVDHGVTGFLVSHGDVDQLAARMREVIENRILRERLSSQALQFAQQFAWTASAERMETFLQGISR
ncbi:MAG TPA: glycosyltransferase family 4 protein [Longimicrobiales bacterium]|nr:glycosyltransferase family 4 protein [Longimicrobiales bacterium]